jgi:hypothetical protein
MAYVSGMPFHRWSFLALALLGCRREGPCLWEAQQDRDTGMVQASSMECDGVAMPSRVSVRYLATSAPLTIEIGTPSLMTQLSFEASLVDGAYDLEPPNGVGEAAPPISSSGANVTGTVTFARSRDVPFIDIRSPELKTYQSSLDVTFDLVAILPHPDPAMGTGCRLETGEQHVTVLVAGPVVDCQTTLGSH